MLNLDFPLNFDIFLGFEKINILVDDLVYKQKILKSF